MSDTTDDLLKEKEMIYGDAKVTQDRIAQVWSGILDTDVSSYQVALMMAGLKLVRADIAPDHNDSLKDAHGYTTIAQEIAESWEDVDFTETPPTENQTSFVNLDNIRKSMARGNEITNRAIDEWNKELFWNGHSWERRRLGTTLAERDANENDKEEDEILQAP